MYFLLAPVLSLKKKGSIRYKKANDTDLLLIHLAK